MGDLILLPTREERDRIEKPTPVSTGESAKILLFMGVRYERHDGMNSTHAVRSPKSKAKKRA